jgi:hypothetical protein
MTSITTPITTPFGFHSTAAEVLADVDLSGKQAGAAVRDQPSRPLRARARTPAGVSRRGRRPHRRRVLQRAPALTGCVRRHQFPFPPVRPSARLRAVENRQRLVRRRSDTRWSEHGIYANALNPGAIHTNLQRHVGGTVKTPLEHQKTPQQGAATSVLLAASPLLDGIGGRYFADCNQATLVDHRPEGFTEPATAVAPYALEPENARRLWELSLAAVS